MKRSWLTRSLSVFLAILIAVFAVPIGVYAEVLQENRESADTTNINEEQTDAGNVVYAGDEVFEVTELREESVKHFRHADGSYSAFQYELPVHVLDENGKWQEIDNTLSESGSEYGTPNARVKFAKKITGNEVLFTLHEQNRKLTMSLDGAVKKTAGKAINTETQLDESATLLQKLTTLDKLTSRVIYSDILEGVDLEYIVESLNIKENLIVKKPLPSYSFSFTMKLNNLTAELGEDGAVVITDQKSGELVYTIPVPVVYDGAGDHAPEGTAYYTLTQTGNNSWKLTVTADDEWMHDPSRVYPVTIDPPLCTNRYNDMTDTYIYSGSPSSSYGGSSYLYVGEANSGEEYITYWKAETLPSLPAGATLISASLTLYCIAFSTYYPTHINVGLYEAPASWSYSSTWNSLNGSFTGSDGLIDSVRIDTYNDGGELEWDITELAESWYVNSSNNTGVVLRGIDNIRSYVRFYSTNANTHRPIYRADYRKVNGTESYWSYMTQGAGLAGNGYVNQATGALTFQFSGWSTDDGLMPYTPSLVYNSNQKNAFFNTSYAPTTMQANTGYGWKLDSQQSVVIQSYYDPSGVSKAYYIWIDADGTEHAFLPHSSSSGTVYYDEDGLGLELEVLSTTTNGMKYQIHDGHGNLLGFDVSGYLVKEIDSFGNERIYNRIGARLASVSLKPVGKSSFIQVSFSYYTGSDATVLTGITYTGTGRSIKLYYSASQTGTTDISQSQTKYLRRIEFYNGSLAATVSYTYSQGYLSEAVDGLSGTKLKYFFNGSGKLANLYEYGEGSVAGQRINMTHSSGRNLIRSSGPDDVYGNSDDLQTVILYDDHLRVINSYVTDINSSMVYGFSSASYLEDEENNPKLANKPGTVSSSGASQTNLLLNGGFEITGNSPWTSINGTTLASVQSGPKSGDRAVQLLFGSGKTSGGCQQSLYLTPGTYTFSAFVRKAGSSSTSSTIRLGAPSGTEVIRTGETLSFASGTPMTLDYIPLSTTFKVTTAGNYTVSIMTSRSSSSYSAIFAIDDAVLVKDEGAGKFSLIEDGSFENPSWTGQKWGGIDTSTAQTHTGRYSLNITGDLDVLCFEGQEISLMSESEVNSIIQNAAYSKENPVRSYLLSGWAKADSLKLRGDRTFGIQAIVEYVKPGSSTREYEYFDASFSDSISSWQFISIPVMTDPEKGYPVLIQIDCLYGYNHGEAYFDDIMLVPHADTVDYTYDSKGRVTAVKNGDVYSSSDTTYYSETDPDAGGEIDTIIYADGKKIKYDYEKHRVIDIWKYDENGGFISYCHILYDDWGNPEYIGEIAGDEGVADTSYTYSQTPRIFGKPLTYEDNTGLVTTYYYNETNGDLLAVTYSDGTGMAYSYDALRRQVSARPALVSGTGYITENNSERALFTYEGSELAAIATATTTYTFDYDAYGNQTAISVGDAEIAKYIYNAANGKLKYVVYGNGYVVKYIYDSLERLSKECYTQISGTLPTSDSSYDSYSYTTACEYVYNSQGYVSEFIDYIEKAKYNYEYDADGKMLSVTRLDQTSGTVSVEYRQNLQYDSKGQLSETEAVYLLGGTQYSEAYSFVYDTAGRLDTLYFGGTSSSDTIYYVYDGMSRLAGKTTSLGSVKQYNLYTYRLANGSKGESETGQVEQFTSTIEYLTTTKSSTAYTYTYDRLGNITEIRLNGVLKYRYSYDNLSQLIREDNAEAGKSYVYAYDKGGNITSKKTYAYTTGTLGSVQSTYDYSYGNAEWGDQMTAYRGVTLSYDALGNPTSYYNGSFCNLFWSKGRKLNALARGSTDITQYVYNAEGNRISKSRNGTVTEYVLDGSRILAEKQGSTVIVYLYDGAGSPIGMKLNGTTYTYEKNLQGDIVGIINAVGDRVVTYVYDAWGNTVSQSYTDSNAFIYNPFRYRGYYRDSESGFYYLGSRYYDPAIGRFINVDSSVNANGDIIGFNMYAYCSNNPIMYVDNSGRFIISIFVAAGLAVVSLFALSGCNNSDYDESDDIYKPETGFDTIEEAVISASFEMEKEHRITRYEYGINIFQYEGDPKFYYDVNMMYTSEMNTRLTVELDKKPAYAVVVAQIHSHPKPDHSLFSLPDVKFAYRHPNIEFYLAVMDDLRGGALHSVYYLEYDRKRPYQYEDILIWTYMN